MRSPNNTPISSLSSGIRQESALSARLLGASAHITWGSCFLPEASTTVSRVSLGTSPLKAHAPSAIVSCRCDLQNVVRLTGSYLYGCGEGLKYTLDTTIPNT